MTPVVWLIVAAAVVGAALEVRVLYAKRREIPAPRASALTIAVAALVLCAGLAALPLFAGEAYGLYRTNSSDAAVNITGADLWQNARAATVFTYVDERSPQATQALLAESPIGIFSARFVEYGVRAATGMMIGLYGALFDLPAYASYLPFLLACAAMGGFASFAMLRQLQAPRWFAALAAFSVISGWSYIIRESDNSNQFGAFPLMIGALLLLAAGFDRSDAPRVRAGLALGLTLAASVTIYPELGLMFGAAVGGALFIRALLSRRREDWMGVGAAAGAGAVVLVLNGQALIIYHWIEVLQSGALNLGSFVGPTGELLERDGWIAGLGLYAPWVPPILTSTVLTVALIGLALAVIRGALTTYVGLAFALFTIICGFLVWRGVAADTPYVSYRAMSFYGMVLVVGAAAAMVAAQRTQVGPFQRALKISGAAGMAWVCLMVAGSAGYWTQAFARPLTDYSTLSQNNAKAYVRALPGLRAAIDRAPRGSIGVYLPPADIAALPWPQMLYVHMMAAHRDAVFLSGFMNDNADRRMPTPNDLYDPGREIEYVLVSVLHDPVPGAFSGERVGHGRGFRLYRIAPTPWRTARDQLASADNQGRAQ